MARRTYKVENIHCAGCEQGIRGGLADVEGIDDVVPDQGTNRVVVTFDDSRIDDQQIAGLLDETGFPVVQTLTADGSDAAERTGPRRRDADPDSHQPGRVGRYG
jgi:copper chaperone CopZ